MFTDKPPETKLDNQDLESFESHFSSIEKAIHLSITNLETRRDNLMSYLTHAAKTTLTIIKVAIYIEEINQ